MSGGARSLSSLLLRAPSTLLPAPEEQTPPALLQQQPGQCLPGTRLSPAPGEPLEPSSTAGEWGMASAGQTGSFPSNSGLS